MLMGLKCVKVLLILSNNVSHSPLKKKKKNYCIPLNDTRLTRRMQTKVSATKQNIPIGKKTRLRNIWPCPVYKEIPPTRSSTGRSEKGNTSPKAQKPEPQ